MQKSSEQEAENTAKAPQFAPTIFMRMSLKRFAVLLVITFGFYGLYWFYKNWQAVEKATGEKMWPFWRTVFSIFWAWPLFLAIYSASEEQGKKPKPSAHLMGFLYVALSLANSALGVRETNWIWFNVGLIALSLAGALVLVFMQSVINNQKLSVAHKKTSGGEIAVIIFGILFTITTAWAMTLPPEGTLTDDQLKMQQKANDLGAQYDACSAELESQRGTLDTANQNAVDSFNEDLDDCEEIRLEQNKAADELNRTLL